MSDFKEKVCLVIPCYNEAERLNFSEMKKYTNDIFYIFVNDGSKDNTHEVLSSNFDPMNMLVLDLKKNVGKSEAVRVGMLKAHQLHSKNAFTWIGYWDADLATPLYEVYHMVKYEKLYGNFDSIWGSRVYRLGSTIKRSHLRHFLGRVFATISAFLFKLETYDSQCGAKLFRPKIVQDIFSTPFLTKWIFDIEILLRLKGQKIIECPLQSWFDVKGGKINFIKDPFVVFWDLIKLKRKY